MASAEPPQDLQRKKNRRTSEDGLPLHGFSSRLQELAPRSPPSPVPDPAPLQTRAMKLWRAFPVNNTPNPAKTPL